MSDESRTTAGIIDAIRDGVATILVGEEETAIETPDARLPDGSREGSRVQVTVADGEVTDIELVEAEPSTEEVRGRLDRLARARPSRLLRRPAPPDDTDGS